MQNSGLYLLYREINLLRHGGDTSIPCDIMYRSHYQQQRVSKIHTELRIRRNLLIHEQPRFLRPLDFDISVTNLDVLFIWEIIRTFAGFYAIILQCQSEFLFD